MTAREALEFYARGGFDGGRRAREALAASRIIDFAEIVETDDGQSRVVAKSSNGETVLWSEAYRDRSWARSVAHDLDVPVIEEDDAVSSRRA